MSGWRVQLLRVALQRGAPVTTRSAVSPLILNTTTPTSASPFSVGVQHHKTIDVCVGMHHPMVRRYIVQRPCVAETAHAPFTIPPLKLHASAIGTCVATPIGSVYPGSERTVLFIPRATRVEKAACIMCATAVCYGCAWYARAQCHALQHVVLNQCVLMQRWLAGRRGFPLCMHVQRTSEPWQQPRNVLNPMHCEERKHCEIFSLGTADHNRPTCTTPCSNLQA